MMFMMHIVAIHAVMVLAGGFIAFHFAGKYPSTSLKAAAWILVIGGALTLLCNGYYGMRYMREGYFDRPLPFEMPMHGQKPLSTPQ